VKTRIGVDVAQLRLDAKGAQSGERLVAEMTVLAGDQHNLHVPRLLEAALSR
jgi:hypothetical protein